MAPTPTIEDLFEFLKKDKADRAQEREKDKKELQALISESVKSEVKSLIDPVSERVSSVEKDQENMSNQLKLISEELEVVKNELKKKSDASQSVCHNQFSKQVTTNNAKDSSEASQTESNELLKIISLGRRTIGLYKIDDADLERMRQEQYGGAKSEEEEKMLAVQEYLRCELKIDSDTIGRMEIERIFPPPGGDPKHLL